MNNLPDSGQADQRRLSGGVEEQARSAPLPGLLLKRGPGLKHSLLRRRARPRLSRSQRRVQEDRSCQGARLILVFPNGEQPTNPSSAAAGRSGKWRYKQSLTRLVEFLEGEALFPRETDIGIASLLGRFVVPKGLVLVIAI